MVGRWRVFRGCSTTPALVAVSLFTIATLLVLRPRIYLPTWRGYQKSNFRQRWWRVTLPATISAEAAAKAALPKYQLPGAGDAAPGFPQFPIFVISMKNSTDRRAWVQQQLQQRGVPFQWFDAVDGSQEIPIELVKWYLTGKRLRDYLASGPGSVDHRYMGCNLSHLRLMHKLIADGAEMQLVFEDDFELYDENGDFLERLRAVMAELPADWEALWLHHQRRGDPEDKDPRPTAQQQADARANTWVGRGVRLTVQNHWAVSLLYRRSFALKVLNDAQIGNKDYDDVIGDVCALGSAACYTADPALAGVSTKDFKSGIRVDKFDGKGRRLRSDGS